MYMGCIGYIWNNRVRRIKFIVNFEIVYRLFKNFKIRFKIKIKFSKDYTWLIKLFFEYTNEDETNERRLYLAVFDRRKYSS